MKIYSLFLLPLAVAVFFIPVPEARAQDAAAQTLSQRASIPLQSSRQSQDVGSGSDLGDVQPVQRIAKPETLTLVTAQEFFYTDNVFFTDANPDASAAYLGDYTVSYVPYSLANWTPRLTAQYNMVRYSDVSTGDFDNENFVASSQYVFGKDRSWTWLAAVNYSRFTAPHLNDHTFYQEVVYDNQITHVQPLLHDTPLFFIATYDLAYHQTDPGIYDRLDNQLSFSLSYYPIQELSIAPFVRPAARTYFNDNATQHDRSDFNLSEGVAVTWTPIKYVSLSTDFIHTDNYSSSSGLSYESNVPAVAVTASIKF